MVLCFDNRSITDLCNTLPTRLKEFVKKGVYINQKEGRSFCYVDFKELSKSNYRQCILKLRPLLEVVVSSNPKFYKFKGIDLNDDSHHVTDRVTGGMPGFDQLLRSLEDQPPMIHDIHLKFESDLHSKLVSMGLSANPTNGLIENIQFPSLDNNINTKILIYPKTILIIIGCTYKPVIYDLSGVYSLMSHLAQIQFYLFQLTKYEVIIPEVKTWTVTRYDFNKDGSTTVSTQSFCYEFDNVTTGLIRFYLKDMKNGEKVARLEQVRTPNHTMQEELESLLMK